MKKPKIQALIDEIRLMPPAEDAASIGLELANRVEEVLKIHVKRRWDGREFCADGCGEEINHKDDWPCPTIRALDGEP